MYRQLRKQWLYRVDYTYSNYLQAFFYVLQITVASPENARHEIHKRNMAGPGRQRFMCSCLE